MDRKERRKDTRASELVEFTVSKQSVWIAYASTRTEDSFNAAVCELLHITVYIL